jgi:hypothetical protein
VAGAARGGTREVAVNALKKPEKTKKQPFSGIKSA